MQSTEEKIAAIKESFAEAERLAQDLYEKLALAKQILERIRKRLEEMDEAASGTVPGQRANVERL